jgi:phosphoribosyl 1,2-cyclic phosphodiesterase
VIVELWGTRGSLPTPGPETVRYGGNTACVEVRTAAGDLLVLDAGTGVRRLGASLPADLARIDVLLTHLHMDHIQGLGFFAALFRPGLEVHIWGPPSVTMGVRQRLARYLSPPLFPIRMADLSCRLELHDAPVGTFEVAGAVVTADLVCHPGPTLGYRIDDGTATLAYLPDHEPALGSREFEPHKGWTSGLALADGVDLLVHDAQYTLDEYPSHIGWGHSALEHAVAFAGAAGAGRLVAFHHDPAHDDATLDRLFADMPEQVVGAREGAVFRLGEAVLEAV